jgi:predicted CoA-substrate-specific enzyme activase
MSKKPVYIGADVGSSRTKVAVLDADKHLLGYAIKKSGTDFTATANECLENSMRMAGADPEDMVNIKLDDKGRRTSFKMNRKCAAGTGAFLEEMSARLDIPLEEMDGLAAQSKDMVKLGSFCTVFSATEVLENIRHGKKIEDIVKGVFFSVIRRVTEMDSMTDNVVMTGGVVAHNPYLIKMAEEMINRKVLVPEHPQLTGAIGAALYAMGN